VRLRLCLIAVVMLTFVISMPLPAQQTEVAKFPTKPINFIIPFPPGGSSDLGCRLICKEAEKYLGQPVVVVNKPGAGGAIGVAAVASAKPDGYTVGMCHGQALFVLPFIETLPYDAVRDFRYLLQFVELNFGVVVRADSPFKSFSDLIAYARANPKKVSYGTNSPNSISRIIMEQIAAKEKVQLTHIPFKGSSEYQAAMLGGHIMFTAGEYIYPTIEAGQARILLFLGEKALPEFSQVPTTKSLGFDFPTPLFNNVACPKGVPDEIARKLEDAFTKATKEPAFIKGMKELHFSILYRNSKEMTDYIMYNYEIFPKILKQLGIIK
jgi:tripartite-type tricarboxylate transporter receptor subunit TctC